MEKIIVQKLHEIEEKEHGKILLAGQWILESEIAGLREKAGKLRKEKKVSWEKLNEIFLKEVQSDILRRERLRLLIILLKIRRR